MSIQNAISELLENANQYDASDVSLDIDSDSIELGYFSWDGSGSPDYELETDYARAQSIEFDGSDLSEYRVIPAQLVDALAGADLSELVGKPDPSEYVSIEALRHAIGDLIMIKPANPSDDGSMPAFVTVSQAVDRAQSFDMETPDDIAAALADAIVDESIEVETDSE